MRSTPFTLQADFDIGSRLAAYLSDDAPDVTISEGPVPAALENPTKEGVSYSVNDRQFLLSVPGGARYLVEDGTRISYERNGKSDREVAVFLLGSAFAALCYQRGLLPIHASAVIENGAVYAFTGNSGAGKSTLSAALTKQGHGFFTDDLIVIDPDAMATPTHCFAVQTQFKLWKDALSLTGHEAREPVRDVPGFEKYYARPEATPGISAGALKKLVFLKNSSDDPDDGVPALTDINGHASLKELRNSVYRPNFALAILGLPRHYQILVKVIGSVQLHIFDRSRKKTAFDDNIAMLSTWIRESQQTETRG